MKTMKTMKTIKLITIEDGIRREVTLDDIFGFYREEGYWDMFSARRVSEKLEENGYEVIIRRKGNG